jgi:hypothetical protein
MRLFHQSFPFFLSRRPLNAALDLSRPLEAPLFLIRDSTANHRASHLNGHYQANTRSPSQFFLASVSETIFLCLWSVW